MEKLFTKNSNGTSTMSVSLRPEQEVIFWEAINKAKENLGIDDTGEAFAAICKVYRHAVQA